MPTLIDLLTDAALSLFSRGMRTLLTTAGVLLGLGALVAISGVTGSMGENVVRQFDRYAATQVLLSAPGDAAAQVSDADLDRLRAVEGVEGVAWICHLGFREVSDAWGGEPVSLEVVGVSPGAVGVLEPRIAVGADAGGVPTLDDRLVALVGTGVAHRLALGSPQQGASLRVDGRNVSVSGVVDDVPRLPIMLNQVVLPLAAMQQHWGDTCAVADIVVRTRPNWAASVGQIARQIVAPQSVGQWTVSVPPSPDALRRGVVADLSVLYGVMAGISLAVGVLSIGNTMSVSVLERRGEIGLRRAVGYSAGGVFALFSLEASAIGFLGGLLGSSLGCLTVIAVALVNGWPVVVSTTLVVLVPFLGGLIGFLGGLVPAVSASRVSPATALRA